MRTALTSILLLVSVTGAHAGPPVSRADKADIVAWARQTLADPYSLRSTYISERTRVRGVEVVCVEFNARNQAGGYTGVDRHPFVDTPQGLRYATMRSDVTSGTCYDPAITLKPFPELSAIR